MKPWYQADLKAFIFSNDQGRAGFKVSFIRGGLPPVFADTKAFRFGFVFETSDDKSSPQNTEEHHAERGLDPHVAVRAPGRAIAGVVLSGNAQARRCRY